MILFIDIETVPVQSTLSEYSSEMQQHWKKKTRFLNLTEEQENNLQLSFEGFAGIFSEWSKIICIGLGYINPKTQELHTTTITSHNEAELLIEFQEVLQQFTSKTQVTFCGHNIKEFDLPFICRRFIVNEISLPQVLNLAGLKPWENNHIDTMQLWKFGEYKRFTSLDLLAATLGIQSPKADMDGSQVMNVYYEENNLEKIANYCLLDIETTAKVYFRIQNKPLPFKTVVRK